MNQIELVVLDMAGTTVQDQGQVPRAFSQALEANHLVVTPAQIETVRGAGKREAFRKLVEGAFGSDHPGVAEIADNAYQMFREILLTGIKTKRTALIPGADKAIKTLRSESIKVALNTGFDREIAEIIVNQMGEQGVMVDAWICGDDVPTGRPAPYMIFRAMEWTQIMDIRRVLVGGDTVLDLVAAFNAGVAYRIGVTSGAHSKTRLSEGPYTHILPSVADLPQLIHKGL